MHVTIAVAQLNPTVGDLEGNYLKLRNAYFVAAKHGADIVVAPECALTGYPLEDLVLRQGFREEADKYRVEISRDVEGSFYSTALIFGSIYTELDKIYNAAFYINPNPSTLHQGGSGMGSRMMSKKMALPNYGVFDEKRVFTPGELPMMFSWHGKKIAVPICEDIWTPDALKFYLDKPDLIIAINGSPYEIGKNVVRRKIAANIVREYKVPFMYVNLVGGQDELVFDGDSFVYDGESFQESVHFEEDVFYFDCDLKDGPINLQNWVRLQPDEMADTYRALVLGTRDYIKKQGFTSVVIGMSGGVDSALVAAIACDAIGPENVHLVSLPSEFSSEGSKTDASEAAAGLGAPFRTISIEDIVKEVRHSYWQPGNPDAALKGVADENIQARARGLMLMAISNQEGHLLLTTGNKSEVSVGYSTLYGDMCGGFNPLKDVYKTTVWELCRWRNAVSKSRALGVYCFLGNGGVVVPEAILNKPPSAELSPGQKDSDSLPPYEILDKILKGLVEREMSNDDLVSEGFEEQTVSRVRNLLDGSEYKRRQSAPGVKITGKLHGRERRYPIVNKWRG